MDELHKKTLRLIEIRNRTRMRMAIPEEGGR